METLARWASVFVSNDIEYEKHTQCHRELPCIHPVLSKTVEQFPSSFSPFPPTFWHQGPYQLDP